MADRRELAPGQSRTAVLMRAVPLGGAIVAVLLVWLSLHAGARLDGGPRPPVNPIEAVLSLATGRKGVRWGTGATIVLVAALVLLAAIVTAIVRGRHSRSANQARGDHAAKWMATRGDLVALSRQGAAAKADQLGVAHASSPGIPLGRAVPSGIDLFSNWENMIVVVAGPRTMKSTAYAIPAIMSAPGALVATSNKRDVVDATRLPRQDFGEVWVFDPQGVATTPATWWWNPLTYIAPFDPTTGEARRDPVTRWVAADEAKAEKLAAQFCASAIAPGAKTDAYFDGEAQNLISLLLLAAACAEEPITTVYTWLTTPSSTRAAAHLEANGFQLHAESLAALTNLPDKQRDGVFGTARARMGFLRNRQLVTWVTPAAEHLQQQFHPISFATSTDTLYLLSKEGEGGAGPLVAALTVAVIDAAEELAATSPGGRLPVPMVAILDEAANICRFRNLDSYYSHFGSRGIIIETILQNWAQGEEVWGDKGMEKLWSAANVKLYGGGVDDDRFLRRISDLIGAHTHLTRSESLSGNRGGTRNNLSVSVSSQERTILTIGELRELPQGRAVMFASGTPAALVEPMPWFRSDYAPQIEASLRQARTSTTTTPAHDSTSPWSVGEKTS